MRGILLQWGVLCILPIRILAATTDCYNDCSGHGTCTSSTKLCTCQAGWGASTDVTLYRSPDCSQRVCPSGTAWVDLATATNTAHALAECSNAGTCNRIDGTCKCFPGFTGSACQRTSCPNDCSGHGQCVNMRTYAETTAGQPISAATTYKGAESTTTWDQEKIFGCLCDSSWTVGLTSGARQVPEWFGPDCSRRHCPSGDDPDTTAVETDCNGVNGGAAGNLCHIDCSNRGLCDFSTGKCNCFDGFFGYDCGQKSELAKKKDWEKS